MCSVGELSPFVLACVAAALPEEEQWECDAGSLSSLLSCLRCSLVPSSAGSLSCWQSSCASGLCECCLRVSQSARRDGWAVEALSAALSALVELHRTSHCQQSARSDVSGYSSCRRHLLRLLAARSADLPPFARPLLSVAQCQTVLACTESLYFPSLHLSQLVHRRTAALTCQPIDERRAQQVSLDRLLPLNAASTVAATSTSTVTASSSSEKAAAITAAALSVTAATDASSEAQQSAVGDSFVSNMPTSPAVGLSSAAQSALSVMQAEFNCRLQVLQRAVPAQ